MGRYWLARVKVRDHQRDTHTFGSNPKLFLEVITVWRFRWGRRASRSFAEWRSVLLRLRKEVAKMQWACRRRSPCTSSRQGEYSSPPSLEGRSVGWAKMCIYVDVPALYELCFAGLYICLLLKSNLAKFVLWRTLSEAHGCCGWRS